MGNTIEPWPFTMRVPPRPYTMSASWGPALRYSLAIPLIRKRMTITPSETKIKITAMWEMPSNITPPVTSAVEERFFRLSYSPPGRLGPSTRNGPADRSEEHTSELQSLRHLVCRLLLEKTRTD